MMPESNLGKYAGGLLVAFLVLLATLFFGVNFGGLPRGTSLTRTVGICTAIAGLATFATGLVSLIKFKDRSFVVILAVFFGAIAVLLITMETLEVIAG
jgi:hypothetical protein